MVDALPDRLPDRLPEAKPKKKTRRYKRTAPTKTQKILALYQSDKQMKNIDIAKKVGCTQEMVGIVLHKIGVRRNRWDGHISKDQRYSKQKRRMQNGGLVTERP